MSDFFMLEKLLIENDIIIEKLSKKSKVAEDKIQGYLDNPDTLTILDACKLGIGFKKCGVYADEIELLGDRYETLFNEWFMRCIKHEETPDDIEYTDLQKTILTGIDITQKRVALGLSRKALADKTGVDVRSIEKYETGEKQIEVAAVKTVYALAKGLGCRIEDIIRKERLE